MNFSFLCTFSQIWFNIGFKINPPSFMWVTWTQCAPFWLHNYLHDTRLLQILCGFLIDCAECVHNTVVILTQYGNVQLFMYISVISGREGLPTEGPGSVHDEDPGAAGHQGRHAQDHGHHLQEWSARGKLFIKNYF